QAAIECPWFYNESVQAFKDENQIIQFVQKTMWLQKFCDLFQDIQDGRILMMLLEELTGCKLEGVLLCPDLK
uniref:Uncharacterized protein n=1 Tax=Neogobius melanostomus TaxID=47308 RepID=A0A8C6WTZ6_9GOBI